MRSLVVLALVTAAPAAHACPHGARCVIDALRITEIAAPRREVAAPRRPISLRVLEAPARPPWRLDEAPPPRPAFEEPWIWQILRREVDARMPRYRDEALTFALAPVVVTIADDSVPGVGIEGIF